jgi:AraC family transcriptional regulator of adaptative response / DNA-3-methyladenine glycosylase II
MQAFLAKRLVPSLEWVTENGYGRTFNWPEGDGQWLNGYFEATHLPAKNAFKIKLYTARQGELQPLIKNIKRILDLDTDIAVIEQQLKQLEGMSEHLISGLRLPGIWSAFEAGIRAILGQQISVEAARKLVCQVVDNYGEQLLEHRLFPTAQMLADKDFSILKIPQSRKNTLIAFCRYCADNPQQDDLDQWLNIKGIGPWTVQYAKMRGLSDSDIWLGSDLGVKKALIKLLDESGVDYHGQFDSEAAKPWRTYLTFQCWSLLS